MKKLILINFVLIISLCIIPKPKKIETETEIEVEVGEQVELNNNFIVTSRSEIDRKIQNIEKISQKGIDFIKNYEGYKLTAYKLPNEKYYTIGYGHNSKDIYEGQTITQEQANNLLKNDLKRYEIYVKNNCEHLNLTQNEFDALVSFTYNCGVGNLKKLIKNRNKQEIAEKFVKYTKSASESNRAGLKNRRTAEKDMFLGGM